MPPAAAVSHPAVMAPALQFVEDLGAITGATDAEVVQLAGGNSHITLLVWGKGKPRTSGVVVKVALPDGPLAPYNVAHEAEMMAEAHRRGVRVPEVLGHRVDPTSRVDMLAMLFVDGETPSLASVRPWIESKSSAAQRALCGSLVDQLFSLRDRSATADSVDLPSTYGAYLATYVRRVEEACAQTLPVPPAVPAVAGWLEAQLPLLAGAPAALVHGDFRIGNIVFAGDAVAGVLDWERAMQGHPMHDVGYLCLPGMRLAGRIGGVFSEDDLADLWAERAGERFDRRLCAYFRIMSMFTELCTMLRAQARFATGLGRLRQMRSMPLIARIHHDLLIARRNWVDGQHDL